MAEEPVQIPNRALFKAAEVCEIAAIQPYVLHSWEAEFADLGVARTEGGPRAYRRADVERILRIKQLVFGEGLTLAGVRRRLSEESGAVAEDVPLDELFGRHARERLMTVKQGLRALLDLLGSNGRAAGTAPTQQSLLMAPAGPLSSHRARTRATPRAAKSRGRSKRRAQAS